MSLKLLLSAFFLLNKEANASECGNTIGGPGVGKPCIFPFTFAKTGKTYTECTVDYGNEYWCSTKVDEDGFHLSGNWGECGQGCPGVPDDGSRGVNTHCPSEEGWEDCTFPFTIDGYSYRGCLPMESFEHGFCMSTSIPQYGSEVEYMPTRSPCSRDCPKDEFITDIDLSMVEILNKLNRQPTVYTTVGRNVNCSELLQDKFEQADKDDLPQIAQSAKSWKEAHTLVCRDSSYCAGHNSKACRTKMVVKRWNKEDDHGEYPLQSDCKIRCGHPD